VHRIHVLFDLVLLQLNLLQLLGHDHPSGVVLAFLFDQLVALDPASQPHLQQLVLQVQLLDVESVLLHHLLHWG
jgi:hypothetical protein